MELKLFWAAGEFRKMIPDAVFQQSSQVHQPAVKEVIRLFHHDQVRGRLDAIHPGPDVVDIHHVILVPLDHQPGTIGVVKAIKGIAVGGWGNGNQLPNVEVQGRPECDEGAKRKSTEPE